MIKKIALLTSYALLSAATYAATLSSTHLGNYFHPNESIIFELDLEDTPPPSSGTATFRILDYQNRVIETQIVTLQNPLTTVTFNSIAQKGFYIVQASDAGAEIIKTTLGILPKAEAPSDRVADPSNLFGTVAHLKHLSNSERDQMLDLIHRGGFGWIREGFLWHEMEPEHGQWNTERYDDLVDRSYSYGLNVLPVLGFGNAWAADTDLDLSTADLRQVKPHIEPWLKYVYTMMDRYGDRIHAWEIWNEPNLRTFWRPTPDAQEYADLLLPTWQYIKSRAPNDTVITAGFSPCKAYLPKEPLKDEELFVRTSIQNGVVPFDAIGDHPYTVFHHKRTNASAEVLFYNNIDAVISGLDNNVPNPQDFPVWLTEMGVSTIPRITTENKAAAHITQIMTLALARSNVDRIILYNFRDVGNDEKNKEHMFGLINNDYTPKPGYFAASTVIDKIGNATFNQRSENNGIITYEFTTADGASIEVIWAGVGSVDCILEAQVNTVTDITGCEVPLSIINGELTITVGSSPIYLEY